MQITYQYRWSILVFSLLALSACDKPGPAENAGREIDHAAEKAGEKIDDATEKLHEDSKSAGVAMDDSAITTKVKAELFAAPDLKSMSIDVNTDQGVVTLTGEVDTQEHVAQAGKIANDITGVKSVENKLMSK